MYRFYVGIAGGSLGWIRWRNTIPNSVFPDWMRRFGDFWGTMAWGNPISEEAFQELVEISQELGFYDDTLPTNGDEPTSDLEHGDPGPMERQDS